MDFFDHEYFCQMLKMAREKKKFTMAKVDRIMGQSRNTYHRWESGLMVPGIDKVVKLSAVLGINIGDLELCKRLN